MAVIPFPAPDATRKSDIHDLAVSRNDVAPLLQGWLRLAADRRLLVLELIERLARSSHDAR